MSHNRDRVALASRGVPVIELMVLAGFVTTPETVPEHANPPISLQPLIYTFDDQSKQHPDFIHLARSPECRIVVMEDKMKAVARGPERICSASSIVNLVTGGERVNDSGCLLILSFTAPYDVARDSQFTAR